MTVIKIILAVILVIDCIAMMVIVLKQEGKHAGLGAIAGGMSETYVSRNQGRTPEGRLVRYTKIMAAIFLVVSLILNIIG